MPNLKTINGNSIYGSGDISISTSATWGSITGTLSSQTDLQTALNALVPYTGATTNVNLGVRTITASSFNGVALTAVGGGTTFLANDGTYKTVPSSTAWGSITGTLSSQTDLQTALNALVPYTGATTNVSLGVRTITASSFNGVALTAAGGGTSYLADDGTYKSVSGSGLTQPQVMARTLGC